MLGRLITRIKCRYGYHDKEFIPVTVTYVLVDNTGIIKRVMEDNKLILGNKNTFMYKCRNCKYEKVL